MKRRAKRAIAIPAPHVQAAVSAFSEPTITRRELILLAIVMAVGVSIRLLALSRSAVEHFDEGVYASNLYFPPPAYAYPLQRFYAPPLLPALIETGMILGLPPNLAALLTSFLAGCGTIVAVWWLGRSWFSPAAGLAAAALVALSDFHVLLSTAALTDALLGLWLVLAVDASARSLARGDYRWAVGAGIYTGLAWWTKYNGWLPLAMEAAALPVLWWLVRPTWQALQRWLGCFATTVVAAGLLWSPYYFSLEPTGGYSPIASNHAKYVVGFSGWLDAARRQTTNHVVLELFLTPWALPLAIVVAALCAPLKLKHRVAALVMAALLVTASLVSNQGSLPFWWALAVAGAWFSAKSLWNFGQPQSPTNPAGAITVLVWLVSLSVATPLYTPYPRLVLPWLLAVCLMAGHAIGLASLGLHSENEARRPQRALVGLLIAMSLAGIAFAIVQPRVKSRPQGERQSVLRVAREVRERLQAGALRAVYVFGEPAMFFQLRAAGEQLVVPVDSVPTSAATIEGPTYLVAGPHAQRDPKFVDGIKASGNWKLVEQWDYQPSALVWLDLHDPRKPSQSSESFQLFEFIR